jgi:hypothetical protein
MVCTLLISGLRVQVVQLVDRPGVRESIALNFGSAHPLVTPDLISAGPCFRLPAGPAGLRFWPNRLSVLCPRDDTYAGRCHFLLLAHKEVL